MDAATQNASFLEDTPEQIVDAALGEALDYAAHQMRSGEPRVRERLQQILLEFKPIVINLVDKEDFESARYAILDMRRSLADALRRRGYDNAQ